ncbi:GNAT family N-acetyltransferase [Streptomyces sp. Li-HN-5-11]|uniref:GNAT family N-acetyltransferase n=1 Tax=Streptomyces sp. Li-HN-5-11 TaxID=3075432 RepID=UPI0028AD7E70|nr:GNAT family N-acetyltransferase [Streptomyces sp. Li-HN-5-11]WNM35352.1 GNAT family N-acetyltransferase [Streptomyces sp. Li-HN-5-11]
MSFVVLRPVTPADSEFCFQLHKAAMGDYVAAVWGWDDADQRAWHERGFDPDRWQIITVEGADAGILIVEYGANEVYLARIELHPDHQGRGIGSQLIRSLIDTAGRRGQSLALDVLAVNTRALAFYRRHGFREVVRHGEDDRKFECASLTSRPTSDDRWITRSTDVRARQVLRGRSPDGMS